jgi:hypothetical protein
MMRLSEAGRLAYVICRAKNRREWRDHEWCFACRLNARVAHRLIMWLDNVRYIEIENVLSITRLPLDALAEVPRAHSRAYLYHRARLESTLDARSSWAWYEIVNS